MDDKSNDSDKNNSNIEQKAKLDEAGLIVLGGIVQIMRPITIG